MAIRHGDDGGVVIDLFDQGPGPVGVFGAGYGGELRPFARRQLAPGVDVGGELVLEDDDLLSLVHRHVGCRDGDPVANGRNNGDAVGVSADEPREQRTDHFHVLEEVVGCDLPGPRLARDGPLSDLARPTQLRRHVGAVQIGDIIGYLEQVALAPQVHP